MTYPLPERSSRWPRQPHAALSARHQVLPQLLDVGLRGEFLVGSLPLVVLIHSAHQDVLKGVSQVFDTEVRPCSLVPSSRITSISLQIHLDWYKHRMYTHTSIATSDPHLSQLGTLSTTHSRFHACERHWKCDDVWADGIGCHHFEPEDLDVLVGPKKFKKPRTGEGEGDVVFVNPSAMPKRKWEEYQEKMDETFAEARQAREVFVEGGSNKRKAGVELPNVLVRPVDLRLRLRCLTLVPHRSSLSHATLPSPNSATLSRSSGPTPSTLSRSWTTKGSPASTTSPSPPSSATTSLPVAQISSRRNLATTRGPSSPRAKGQGIDRSTNRRWRLTRRTCGS